MKKFFITVSILFSALIVFSQKLGQVSFLNGANLSFFSVLTDQNVLIRISEDGKILEWGSEILSDRGSYYAPKLQPFMGRTDYYNAEPDVVLNGKVKSIGISSITYYNSNEDQNKRGKVKSIGNLFFDYYATYDDKSIQGKLKSIGNLLLEYYRPYDNESYRGKLKSIGSMAITYYSGFDDKFNAGKLKSVGATSYTWYSQYDRARGALKSNNYRQVIGGVTFILR